MQGAKMRRGTLERVPQTPQNFPRMCYNTRLQPSLRRVSRYPSLVPPGFSPPLGCLYGMIVQCRKRFSPGVPGALAPGEIN